MKLYIVTIEDTLVVSAESSDEAEEAARRAVVNGELNEVECMTTREVKGKGDIPHYWEDYSIPFGEDERNIAEWIEHIEEKKKQAEADAAQHKLEFS